MTRVFKATELHIKTVNKVGVLASVTSPVTEAGININACCIYADGKDAHFLMVTNDNDRAIAALTKAGYKPKKSDVVVVETKNEAGSLTKAAVQLSEAGVNVDYCYATTGNEGTTWIVFATKEIEKALNTIS